MVLFIITDMRKIIVTYIYGQHTQKSNVLIPGDLFITICIWLINAYIIGWKYMIKLTNSRETYHSIYLKINNWTNHISLCSRIVKLQEHSHCLLVSHARHCVGPIDGEFFLLCTWLQMFRLSNVYLCQPRLGPVDRRYSYGRQQFVLIDRNYSFLNLNNSFS